MEIQPKDRPSPGHSNEPKAITHIRMASKIRVRVPCIGFILSNVTGLPPLVDPSFFLSKFIFFGFFTFGDFPYHSSPSQTTRLILSPQTTRLILSPEPPRSLIRQTLGLRVKLEIGIILIHLISGLHFQCRLSLSRDRQPL